MEKNTEKGLHYLETEPDLKQTFMNIGIASYYNAKAEVYLFYNEHLKAYQHIKEAGKYVKSLIGLNYVVKISVVAFHSASACLADSSISEMDKKELKKRSCAAYNPCCTCAIVPQKVRINNKNKLTTVILDELKSFIIDLLAP